MLPHNTNVEPNNQKKNNQLGMSHGSATHKLRKAILFQLVQKTDQDICYQCKKRIETIDEFSIEHIKPWLDSDNPGERFFDLDNIAFSHLVCNIKASRTPHKREWPPGQAWCWECKQMKSLSEFRPSKMQNRSATCRPCSTATVRRLRRVSPRSDKALKG